jgi:hypothetical protein
MSDKKFRSIDGTDVHVKLTSGHTAVIGKDWRPLPDHMHREAYANGCISDNMLQGMAGPKEPPGKDGDKANDPERAAKILAAIKVMIDANKPEKFTTTGLPRADALSEAVGFEVTSAERDAAWTAAKE